MNHKQMRKIVMKKALVATVLSVCLIQQVIAAAETEQTMRNKKDDSNEGNPDKGMPVLVTSLLPYDKISAYSDKHVETAGCGLDEAKGAMGRQLC